jgi:dihydroorotate dehydrogenase
MSRLINQIIVARRMKTVIATRTEKLLRPLFRRGTPEEVIARYSQGRKKFTEWEKQEHPTPRSVPTGLERTLWGITFRSPIMNAAGMFKNGECYDLVGAQGAGGYIAGTTTANPRTGNEKNNIHLPFVTYPESYSASNWLGLPNNGHDDVAKTLQLIHHRKRIPGCPIGISVMGDPEMQGEDKLKRLVEGMKLYKRAGVDFLELNESCPNTAHGKPQDSDLYGRLRFIKERFLDQRHRVLPVVVKFSNDTEPSQIPFLLDMLFELGFDGVNFGNTSTRYDHRRQHIHESDKNIFDHFIATFGGGVSGRPLKADSLTLSATAVQYRKAGAPKQEFHVWRTGGIENEKDILTSDAVGISMNQWFTGCRDALRADGHDLYKRLYERYQAKKSL